MTYLCPLVCVSLYLSLSLSLSLSLCVCVCPLRVCLLQCNSVICPSLNRPLQGIALTRSSSRPPPRIFGLDTHIPPIATNHVTL